MPEPLATFRGAVSCRCAPDIPGLTLSGDTAEAPGEKTALAFSAAAPAQFPDSLQDARVERQSPGRYRISSATGEWFIDARAVHLHREIAADFYRAIPPRRVPWRKRLFWRLVLTLAASRAGLTLLRMLRR
ncbi:MAG TPA: hypothetical protein VEK10_06435 [Steroidobacteraceae bacterium]|nr:hypothetical protein [Steroidobacteraceae bacterium]